MMRNSYQLHRQNFENGPLEDNMRRVTSFEPKIDTQNAGVVVVVVVTASSQSGWELKTFLSIGHILMPKLSTKSLIQISAQIN